MAEGAIGGGGVPGAPVPDSVGAASGSNIDRGRQRGKTVNELKRLRSEKVLSSWHPHDAGALMFH